MGAGSLKIPLTIGGGQVEYYMSDENLKYDKFFHEKIAGEKDGWLDACHEFCATIRQARCINLSFPILGWVVV